MLGKKPGAILLSHLSHRHRGIFPSVLVGFGEFFFSYNPLFQVLLIFFYFEQRIASVNQSQTKTLKFI